MASEASQITIERDPDEVWALVGQFGDLSYMPGVESCTVEGDVRTVSTMGMEIKEQLVARRDEDRSFTYAIVGGAVPVDSHEATVSVQPEGDASRVTWAVTVSPDDALGLFVPVYEGSLKALKAHLERGTGEPVPAS